MCDLDCGTSKSVVADRFYTTSELLCASLEDGEVGKVHGLVSVPLFFCVRFFLVDLLRYLDPMEKPPIWSRLLLCPTPTSNG